MKLYLARHGEYALDVTTGRDTLTEKGLQAAEQTADFLRPLYLSLAGIFHSGKFRARQTAEILAKGFQCHELPAMRAGLNPEDDVQALAAELSSEEKDILFVGHLPFMSKLTSQLIEGKEDKEIIDFEPGTIVCLNQIERARWAVSWVLTPHLLSAFALS